MISSCVLESQMFIFPNDILRITEISAVLFAHSLDLFAPREHSGLFVKWTILLTFPCYIFGTYFWRKVVKLAISPPRCARFRHNPMFFFRDPYPLAFCSIYLSVSFMVSFSKTDMKMYWNETSLISIVFGTAYKGLKTLRWKDKLLLFSTLGIATKNIGSCAIEILNCLKNAQWLFVFFAVLNV